MRIITGKYKGQTVDTIEGLTVRPATERVKSTIYNMLQNRLGLVGAEVLDLFAGSGSLGFEALSRGANHVTFVDDTSEILDVIEKNTEKLDCIKDCVIIQSDAMAYLEKVKDQYDLIFADPPYAYEKTSELPRIIFKKNILKKNGYLIIEHSKHTQLAASELYTISAQKEFGNTRVSFFIHPKDKGDEK